MGYYLVTHGNFCLFWSKTTILNFIPSSACAVEAIDNIWLLYLSVIIGAEISFLSEFRENHNEANWERLADVAETHTAEV